MKLSFPCFCVSVTFAASYNVKATNKLRRATANESVAMDDTLLQPAELLCSATGATPNVGCISWNGGRCTYNSTVHPEWADALVASLLGDEPTCTADLNVNCVNTTVSARVFTATACAEELVVNASLADFEFAQLPPGQLRLSEGGTEMLITPDTSESNHNRELGTYSCSSLITHTCTRESTGYVFDSRYDAVSGTTLKYSEDWQKSPQSVIYLNNNELLKWTATCSKSSLSVTKKHVFKAGGSSVVARETTRGRSTKTVFARCIALNAYCLDFSVCT